MGYIIRLFFEEVTEVFLQGITYLSQVTSDYLFIYGIFIQKD